MTDYTDRGIEFGKIISHNLTREETQKPALRKRILVVLLLIFRLFIGAVSTAEVIECQLK
jgi:hypothetical protein